MNDHTVAWAAAELAAHLAHRDRLITVLLDDDPATPGAQSLEQDRVAGHSTVLWCEEHELDPADCRRLGRWAGDTTPDFVPDMAAALPCRGLPMPVATDTVGELVVSGRSSRARSVLAMIDAAETQLVRAVEQLVGLHDRFGPAPTQPAAAVVQGVSRDGEPGCQSCARLHVNGRPWWNDPLYNQSRPTNLGGALPTKVLLCKECYGWALNHDHDQCLTHNATAKKSKVKPIQFSGPVHLPPVKKAFESLDLRQRTGYWRGKPGRAVAPTVPDPADDRSPEARRARRRERLGRSA